jgi:hypothetical protein
MGISAMNEVYFELNLGRINKLMGTEIYATKTTVNDIVTYEFEIGCCVDADDRHVILEWMKNNLPKWLYHSFSHFDVKNDYRLLTEVTCHAKHPQELFEALHVVYQLQESTR